MLPLECASCHREIYVGDDVKRIKESGEYVHDGKCAEEFAAEIVYDADGQINDKGEIE